MYELEAELGTRKVPSFLPKRPRIASSEWHRERPAVTAIFNANYTTDGRLRWTRYDDPWTVIGPGIYEAFVTHAEAIAYATASAVDPTPQTQEQVTAGWQPTPDREEAWQEKWNLTR